MGQGTKRGAAMTRHCQAIGAGMAALHLLPQSAGCAITSDLARVVCALSRMASCFTSNVSQLQLEMFFADHALLQHPEFAFEQRRREALAPHLFFEAAREVE